jgi:amidophosphoribosyltransferase
MLTSDKFRDECGVVAIYSHPEAETLAYLGLHALQHRGQESAGIVTSDGLALHIHKAMGLVADIFTEKKLSRLRGTIAIGHTRYSTTGDSALLNAQPIMVQSNKGMIALAHNGNLTNAQEIRSRMESQGSIFQTSSDTEVIVHLIAQSREHTLPEAIADALRRCFLAGHDQPRSHFRRSRSPRLPSPGHGTHPRAAESTPGHNRLRFRNLRIRPSRRDI